MNPILIRLFDIPIYSYGFMLAMSFAICLLLIIRKAKTAGVSIDQILDLAVFMIIFGIIGARILYVIINWEYYENNLFDIFLLNKGGLIFYGGLVGAFVGGLWIAKRRKLPILKIADIIFVYLPLGQAIGRIGCYLNGCCYGKPTETIYGVEFPKCSIAAYQFGEINRLYPAQIYSSVCNLLIFIILNIRIKSKKYDGQIILDYMLLYGIARYFIEYLRGDNQILFYGLSIAQYISLFLIVFSLLARLIKNAGRKSI